MLSDNIELADDTIDNTEKATEPMLGADLGLRTNKAEAYRQRKVRETMPRRKLTRLLKIGCIVIIVAVVLIIIAAASTGRKVSEVIHLPFQQPKHSILKLGHVSFNPDSNTIVFTDVDLNEEYLKLSLPTLVNFRSGTVQPQTACRKTLGDAEIKFVDPDSKEDLKDLPQMCLHFDGDVHAAVYEINIEKLDCHMIHWYSESHNATIEQCIDMSDDNWYGGGALSIQRWPLNRVNVSMQPYVTWQFNRKTSHDLTAHFDAFIEPYFVSANGAAILLDTHLPLFVSINYKHSKQLCFRSSFHQPYHPHSPSDLVLLKYVVCKDRSAKAIHRHLLRAEHLSHPLKPPNMLLLIKPIWSTRGIFPSTILEKEVISYVQSIKGHGLPYSQLFIDGNYSKSPGNFYFSEEKFPHATQFIMELMSDTVGQKLPVGIEIRPELAHGTKNDKFALKQVNDIKPSRLGKPLIVNVSNNEASKWYSSELNDLKTNELVAGFRFSGGQASNFMKDDDGNFINLWKESQYLNKFTQKYATLASTFQENSVMSSGFKSQEYGLIADAGPLLSTWDHRKGLKSIIPTVITYGLMGYPFVMAGPVGGTTGQVNVTSGHAVKPDRELYIRWLQLATFLPAMELSVGPWEYDQNVVNYTRILMHYRQTVLWPKYLSAAVKEAVQVGTPIVRPLWWVAGKDKTAQHIDCEFFVSNSLLVAPVLVKGQVQRDIYLPQIGWWYDQLHGKYYKGGQWLQKFHVGLFEIATFIQKLPPKSLRY